MFSEFKAFIAQGNVMSLAVGVIIGAAFGTIVTSLTADLIMPIVGAVVGDIDFSNLYVVLSGTVAPGTSLEAARASGANVLAWGNFVSTVINFLILAFVIFLMVKQINRLKRQEPAAPPAPPTTPEDVLLLREIRDSLRK